MLDWTTSFLSDKTILNLDLSAVKQFLWGHDMWWCQFYEVLVIAARDKKKPRILVRGPTETNLNRGNSPENPDQPLLPHEQSRSQAISH
jgi:hypothetical protein